MKKKIFIILMVLAVVFPVLSQESKTGIEIKGDIYKDEEMGIEINLPPGSWFKEEKSTGPARIVVLNNPQLKPFKFSIKVFPEYLGITHAKDLESQLKTQFGGQYKRIQFEDASTENPAKSRLVYTLVKESSTLKICVDVILRNDNVYLFQVSAPTKEWKGGNEKYLIFQNVSFTK